MIAGRVHTDFLPFHSLPLFYGTGCVDDTGFIGNTKALCLPALLLFIFFLLDRFPVIKCNALRGSRLAQER